MPPRSPGLRSHSCRRCSAPSPMPPARRSRGSPPAAPSSSSPPWRLWFAAPGQPRAIPLALVCFAIGTIAVEVAAVFNNAMIPSLVPPERFGRLSGTGWAIGYLGGLVSLVIVLGFLAGDAGDGQDLLRHRPALRALDRAAVSRGRPHHGSLLGDLVPRLRHAALPLHARSRAFEAPCRRGGPRGPAAGTEHDCRCAPPRERRALPHRQHGLPGRARGAVRVRRHLWRRRVRLAGDGTRHLRHPPHRHRHARRASSADASTIASAQSPSSSARSSSSPSFASVSSRSAATISSSALRQRRPPTATGSTARRRKSSSSRSGSSSAPWRGRCRPPRAALLARLVPPAEAGRYFGLLALSGKVTSFLAPLTVALATAVFGTQAAGPARADPVLPRRRPSHERRQARLTRIVNAGNADSR